MNVNEATTAELIQYRAEVDTQIRDIREQVNNAKRTAYVSGQYADSEWFRRASTALRIKQNVSTTIQAELAKRNQQRRTEAHMQGATFERAFVRVAKRTLPPEQFEQLCAAAVAITATTSDEVTP